jgi:hypothetical protein
VTAEARPAKPGRDSNGRHGINFRLPMPEAWSALVRDLKLNPRQVHELDRTLRHIDEDLKNFHKAFEGRKPRKELVRRLKRMAKVLSDLEFEIQRSRKTMTDFLPFDSLEAIGLAMSFTAMEAALKRNIPSRGVKDKVLILAACDSGVRIAQIEQAFDYQRKTLGLKHGPELLAHLVERIYRRIKTWIELDRRNPGGRPSNMVRDYLLLRLMEAAPDIIGSRATATANGKFVRLCAALFPACGVSNKGIEKAVERALTAGVK